MTGHRKEKSKNSLSNNSEETQESQEFQEQDVVFEGGYEGGFGDDSFSTERFDASTHTDKMNRAESVEFEKAVLVGAYLPGQGKSEKPLDELAGLAEAAGVIPVGELIQRRTTPDPKTYLGRGKLEELQQLVESADADVVLFDNDLAPSQTRNLEQTLKVKVIDRTELILDIFATRAQTHEAILAVELAQLEYSLPRLRRMWTHLERQAGVGAGGGVGLRGPGEKQLEVDRRIAQKRIADLKSELDNIQERKKREVEGRKTERTVCLVGYTNAGKSTLLNRLTSSDVYVENLLFATLDTRTRRWQLPGWGPVLLSDTVGFIRDLPHHLVASFRATLEEAAQADLLIHVADAGNPEVGAQIASANDVLQNLGMREKETVLVLNKIDSLSSNDEVQRICEQYPTAVPISAAEGSGLERLTAVVSEALSREFLEMQIEMPVHEGRLMALLSSRGEVLSKEFSAETGIARIHCRIPKHLLGQLKKESALTIIPVQQ